MYRIPGICCTPNGVVLAHTEARLGQGKDWDAIDIVMRRSFDNGETWDAPRVTVDHRYYGDGPMNNCNTIVDHETGDVHFLFCFNYARAFYMKSSDDGATFTTPVEITEPFEAFRPEYDWGVIAIGLPNGIQLRVGPNTGRLVIPVWLSESKTQAHRPNRCAVIYSDDHGQSWQRGDMVPDAIPNLNEATIVERSNGSVMLNMRNGIGVKRRVITASSDGVSNWATPWLDPVLVEPTCQGTLFRFSTEGEGSVGEGCSRILFCNPDSLEGKDVKGPSIFLKRQNLTVKMSYDEGQSWPISKVIESGLSGYSALTVCPDKSILALFERGALGSQSTDDYLTLARFNLAWLTEAQDTKFRAK